MKEIPVLSALFLCCVFSSTQASELDDSDLARSRVECARSAGVVDRQAFGRCLQDKGFHAVARVSEPQSALTTPLKVEDEDQRFDRMERFDTSNGDRAHVADSEAAKHERYQSSAILTSASERDCKAATGGHPGIAVFDACIQARSQRISGGAQKD